MIAAARMTRERHMIAGAGVRLAQAHAARTLHRQRERAARRFPLHDLSLPLAHAPSPYSLALPADPDGLLDQLAAWQRGDSPPPVPPGDGAASDARRAVAQGLHLPYWALLWPSGMALAEALLAQRESMRGQRTLELGCGLGVTATAALQAGARLWAADCFGDALLFCRYNTLRNAGRMPSTLLLDWRTAAGRAQCAAAGPFALVLAADVLYEREDEAPLLDLIPRLLSPGGVLWLAHPGRRVAHSFVAAARERGWRERATDNERVWPYDTTPTRVTLHRFRLPAALSSGSERIERS
jgi:predicted nicotinamide N-methyase